MIKLFFALVVSLFVISANAETIVDQRPVCGSERKCLKTVSPCIDGAYNYTFLTNIVCVTYDGHKIEYKHEEYGGGMTGGAGTRCENARKLILSTYESCK